MHLYNCLFWLQISIVHAVEKILVQLPDNISTCVFINTNNNNILQNAIFQQTYNIQNISAIICNYSATSFLGFEWIYDDNWGCSFGNTSTQVFYNTIPLQINNYSTDLFYADNTIYVDINPNDIEQEQHPLCREHECMLSESGCQVVENKRYCTLPYLPNTSLMFEQTCYKPECLESAFFGVDILFESNDKLSTCTYENSPPQSYNLLDILRINEIYEVAESFDLICGDWEAIEVMIPSFPGFFILSYLQTQSSFPLVIKKPELTLFDESCGLRECWRGRGCNCRLDPIYKNNCFCETRWRPISLQELLSFSFEDRVTKYGTCVFDYCSTILCLPEFSECVEHNVPMCVCKPGFWGDGVTFCKPVPNLNPFFNFSNGRFVSDVVNNNRDFNVINCLSDVRATTNSFCQTQSSCDLELDIWTNFGSNPNDIISSQIFTPNPNYSVSFECISANSDVGAITDIITFDYIYMDGACSYVLRNMSFSIWSTTSEELHASLFWQSSFNSGFSLNNIHDKPVGVLNDLDSCHIISRQIQDVQCAYPWFSVESGFCELPSVVFARCDNVLLTCTVNPLTPMGYTCVSETAFLEFTCSGIAFDLIFLILEDEELRDRERLNSLTDLQTPAMDLGCVQLSMLPQCQQIYECKPPYLKPVNSNFSTSLCGYSLDSYTDTSLQFSCRSVQIICFESYLNSNDVNAQCISFQSDKSDLDCHVNVSRNLWESVHLAGGLGSLFNVSLFFNSLNVSVVGEYAHWLAVYHSFNNIDAALFDLQNTISRYLCSLVQSQCFDQLTPQECAIDPICTTEIGCSAITNSRIVECPALLFQTEDIDATVLLSHRISCFQTAQCFTSCVSTSPNLYLYDHRLPLDILTDFELTDTQRCDMIFMFQEQIPICTPLSSSSVVVNTNECIYMTQQWVFDVLECGSLSVVCVVDLLFGHDIACFSDNWICPACASALFECQVVMESPTPFILDYFSCRAPEQSICIQNLTAVDKNNPISLQKICVGNGNSNLIGVPDSNLLAPVFGPKRNLRPLILDGLYGQVEACEALRSDLVVEIREDTRLSCSTQSINQYPITSGELCVGSSLETIVNIGNYTLECGSDLGGDPFNITCEQNIGETHGTCFSNSSVSTLLSIECDQIDMFTLFVKMDNDIIRQCRYLKQSCLRIPSNTFRCFCPAKGATFENNEFVLVRSKQYDPNDPFCDYFPPREPPTVKLDAVYNLTCGQNPEIIIKCYDYNNSFKDTHQLVYCVSDSNVLTLECVVPISLSSSPMDICLTLTKQCTKSSFKEESYWPLPSLQLTMPDRCLQELPMPIFSCEINTSHLWTCFGEFCQLNEPTLFQLSTPIQRQECFINDPLLLPTNISFSCQGPINQNPYHIICISSENPDSYVCLNEPTTLFLPVPILALNCSISRAVLLFQQNDQLCDSLSRACVQQSTFFQTFNNSNVFDSCIFNPATNETIIQSPGIKCGNFIISTPEEPWCTGSPIELPPQSTFVTNIFASVPGSKGIEISFACGVLDVVCLFGWDCEQIYCFSECTLTGDCANRVLVELRENRDPLNYPNPPQLLSDFVVQFRENNGLSLDPLIFQTPDDQVGCVIPYTENFANQQFTRCSTLLKDCTHQCQDVGLTNFQILDATVDEIGQVCLNIYRSHASIRCEEEIVRCIDVEVVDDIPSTFPSLRANWDELQPDQYMYCTSSPNSTSLSLACLVNQRDLDFTPNRCRTIAQQCRFLDAEYKCLNGWQNDNELSFFCSIPPLLAQLDVRESENCNCDVQWIDTTPNSLYPISLFDLQTPCYTLNDPQDITFCMNHPFQESTGISLLNLISTQFPDLDESQPMNVITDQVGITCANRGYLSMLEFFMVHINEANVSSGGFGQYITVDVRDILYAHFIIGTLPFVTLSSRNDISMEFLTYVETQLAHLFISATGANLNIRPEPLPNGISSINNIQANPEWNKQYWCIDVNSANIVAREKLVIQCSVRLGTGVQPCTFECPYPGLYQVTLNHSTTKACCPSSGEDCLQSSQSCSLGKPTMGLRECAENLFNSRLSFPNELPSIQSQNSFSQQLHQIRTLCFEHPECQGYVLDKTNQGIYYLRRPMNFPEIVLNDIDPNRNHAFSKEQQYILHRTANSKVALHGQLTLAAPFVFGNVYVLHRHLGQRCRDIKAVDWTFVIRQNMLEEKIIRKWTAAFLIERDREFSQNYFHIPSVTCNSIDVNTTCTQNIRANKQVFEQILSRVSEFATIEALETYKPIPAFVIPGTSSPVGNGSIIETGLEYLFVNIEQELFRLQKIIRYVKEKENKILQFEKQIGIRDREVIFNRNPSLLPCYESTSVSSCAQEFSTYNTTESNTESVEFDRDFLFDQCFWTFDVFAAPENQLDQILSKTCSNANPSSIRNIWKRSYIQKLNSELVRMEPFRDVSVALTLPNYMFLRTHVPIWSSTYKQSGIRDTAFTQFLDISDFGVTTIHVDTLSTQQRFFAGVANLDNFMIQIKENTVARSIFNQSHISYPSTHIRFKLFQNIVSYFTWLLWQSFSLYKHDYDRTGSSSEFCPQVNQPIWAPKILSNELSGIGCNVPLCPLPVDDTFSFSNGIESYPNPEFVPNRANSFPCDGDHGVCISQRFSSVKGYCDCSDEFTVGPSMTKIVLEDEFGKRFLPSSLVTAACEFDRRGICTPVLNEELSGQTQAPCFLKGECTLDFVNGFRTPVCECGSYPYIDGVKCDQYSPNSSSWCIANNGLEFLDFGYTTEPGSVQQCTKPPSGCTVPSNTARASFTKFQRGERYGCEAPRLNLVTNNPHGRCTASNLCECDPGYYGAFCEYITIENGCFNPSATTIDPNTCIWNYYLHAFEIEENSNIPQETIALSSPLLQIRRLCGANACNGKGYCSHDDQDNYNFERQTRPPIPNFQYYTEFAQLLQLPFADDEIDFNATMFVRLSNQFCTCEQGWGGQFCEERICDPECNEVVGESCFIPPDIDDIPYCICPETSSGYCLTSANTSCNCLEGDFQPQTTCENGVKRREDNGEFICNCSPCQFQNNDGRCIDIPCNPPNFIGRFKVPNCAFSTSCCGPLECFPAHMDLTFICSVDCNI